MLIARRPLIISCKAIAVFRFDSESCQGSYLGLIEGIKRAFAGSQPFVGAKQ